MPLRRAIAIAALVSLLPTSSTGQSTGGAVPRTPDGRPDFSGIWQVMNTAAWNLEPHVAQPGVPAGLGVVTGGRIPHTASALARRNDNAAKRATLDPNARCYLPGVPRIMYMPFPFQIVQTPSLIVFLFEYVHAVRNVFMNSPHPKGPIEWWMGDSRGRWEGDTLVVDVVHFGANTWLDAAGNFHSEQLHLVERLTPMGQDHINYEVTVEDPGVFTEPWTMSMILYRHKERNLRLLEYECYSFEAPEVYRPLHER
jgi:hypothetical protein